MTRVIGRIITYSGLLTMAVAIAAVAVMTQHYVPALAGWAAWGFVGGMVTWCFGSAILSFTKPKVAA